ncbi:hypothetical protein J1N10_14930 [Carboxylicivirga sp. A043]|uniref:hypothetical protein n=1 Tax=Carboxylicivirga litoralis TaxID=2816963 RepID=UPI0021CB3A0B|nr:hypothetical protein [Carboxylicivirga sp. A043]MCU4157268.1 hypothetical protein [Carboxylicivirga sp. A043]
MTININNKYFYSEHNETIVTLHLDYSIFLEDESFTHKNKLLEFLEMIESNKTITTLIISNDYPGFQLDTYKDKWDTIYESTDFESNIIRVFRTYNQVFLKIKSMQKIVLAMFSKPVNIMLFNLGMAADLRFVSRDFYVDNNNYNFVNIPKGGAAFSEARLMYVNPVKMLFQSDKIFSSEIYKKHLVDEVVNPEELMERVMTVAKRYSQFNYIEFEAVKMVNTSILKRIDLLLQKENDYLLSCIRKKKNAVLN